MKRTIINNYITNKNHSLGEFHADTGSSLRDGDETKNIK
jgi:hypothetical protein